MQTTSRPRILRSWRRAVVGTLAGAILAVGIGGSAGATPNQVPPTTEPKGDIPWTVTGGIRLGTCTASAEQIKVTATPVTGTGTQTVTAQHTPEGITFRFTTLEPVA